MQTERLLLRPMVEKDIPELYRLVYADPEVAPPFCGRVKSLEEVEPFLRLKIEEIKHHGGFGSYMMERREDGVLVGQMLLGLPTLAHYLRLDEDPFPQFNSIEVELGYALGRAFWGHGYVTEAGKALLKFAFEELKLRRVFTGNDPAKNPRSAAVGLRLGARMVPNRHPNWPGMVMIVDNPIIGVIDK